MTKELMLIGGSGRSGTTVLCRTFGLHPQVTDVPEWRFATDPDGVLDFYTASTYGIQSPYFFDTRLKRLEALLRAVSSQGAVGAVIGSARVRRLTTRASGRNWGPRYARINASDYAPNFDALVDQFIDELVRYRYSGYWVGMRALEKRELVLSNGDTTVIHDACRRFLEGVASDVCAHQNATHHLEKNTWSILSWDRALEVTPQARLVHIVRDPRDVVASYSQQPWVPSDPLESARVLASIMEEWEVVRRRVPSQSYREVRLEDISADPKGQLEELCQFWGIEWNEGLLGIPYSSASFGRWKKDLSPAMQNAIEPYIAPILERYGYE